MNTIIERIKKAYHLETDAEVASFLDLNPSTLSMQKNRGRLNIRRIIDKCDDLNKNWLLEGEGAIKKDDIIYQDDCIEVYSQLNLNKENTIDFETSSKAGIIYADEIPGFPHLASSRSIIGYIVPDDNFAAELNAHDIIIIDLEQKNSSEGKFLISSTPTLAVQSIEKSDSQNSTGEKSRKLVTESEIHSIIGKIVWTVIKVE